MIYDGVLEGKYVDLKSCTEDDAEFTLALRTDPKLGKFFPSVNNSVEQQREWIRKQRDKVGDYFFVVWSKSGERIGTISVYNIENGEGEGGRIIIRSDNPFDATEAQLLLSKFGYHVLGLKNMKGFVYADNKRALRFNKLFSARMSEPEMDETGKMIVRLETSSDEFKQIENRISKLIYSN